MLDEEKPTIAAGIEGSPQSPMEALRAKRDEIESNREVMIPLIGYDDTGLKCKYRLLDRSETDKIAKKVRQQSKGKGQAEFMFNVLIDSIIAACEGFYLDNGLDEPTVLEHEKSKDPVENYQQLAEELGFEGGTARQAVLYVFGYNDFAAGQHGLLLQRWLSDTNMDIDEALLGEG